MRMTRVHPKESENRILIEDNTTGQRKAIEIEVAARVRRATIVVREAEIRNFSTRARIPGAGRTEDETRISSESHRGNPSSVSQKSIEPAKSEATSPLDSSADARSRRITAAKTPSLDGLDNVGITSGSIKKILSEDHSQKRLESNVNTPKATTESPALTSGNSLLVGRMNDQPEEGMRRMSMVTAEPISGGHTKYYRGYHRYRALAVSLKRKADEITRIQHNPRLGAIVYFLSGNAFLRAFHLNDKHFELLHSNQPDLVRQESMKCWGSMKQFSTALSVQCHGKFQGLDGLSYLLEALVYYKCHTYSNHRLRQEMQAIESFRKRASSEALGAVPVMITTELASRLLQNAEDWTNLSTKLVDCEAALTPDIAREQFPETFKKWCIHPDDIGKSNFKGFSTVVEQKQTVIVGMLDGVPIQEENVRKFPKIQWPLGTYMSLSNLMDFAEEALNEYQVKNGLQYDVSTLH
ncbi:hypothetical protein BGZ58_008222 [Dissophora ornata]|nr:hypothetical protein BGZ58_008222 [Dissophora ornata]